MNEIFKLEEILDDVEDANNSLNKYGIKIKYVKYNSREESRLLISTRLGVTAGDDFLVEKNKKKWGDDERQN